MREEQEIEVELSTTAHLVYHAAPSLKWSSHQVKIKLSAGLHSFWRFQRRMVLCPFSFKKPPAFLGSQPFSSFKPSISLDHPPQVPSSDYSQERVSAFKDLCYHIRPAFIMDNFPISKLLHKSQLQSPFCPVRQFQSHIPGVRCRRFAGTLFCLPRCLIISSGPDSHFVATYSRLSIEI